MRVVVRSSLCRRVMRRVQVRRATDAVGAVREEGGVEVQDWSIFVRGRKVLR